MSSFNTIYSLISTVIAGTAIIMGIGFLCFPVLVVFALKDRAKRQRKYQRERFARERMIEKVVADVAASNHTPTPSVREYPAPADEPKGIAAISNDAMRSIDSNGADLNDYPDPEEE